MECEVSKLRRSSSLDLFNQPLFSSSPAILVLYLTQKLFMEQDTATMVYHAFTSCVYFFCVAGGIIADSWWGKFKTIVILSFVYAIGSVIISMGAMPPLKFPGL